MLKLYVCGLFVLAGAILLNALAYWLQLGSWYNLINRLQETGTAALRQLSWYQYAWLLVGYPLLLGCCYRLGELLLEQLRR